MGEAMAAAVVYDGVNGENGGGTLFGGLRFFILQRVPQRQTFVDLVKSNGGKIVLLEKHADIVIADHLRKDAPAGSLSYKFIEESVKNGRLEDTGKHLIGRPTAAQRPAGSSLPVKLTRTQFTHEEDLALTQWVVTQVKQGERDRGNKIYQIFAETHPGHTWQSWRSHWLSKLAPLVRPDDQSPIPSSQRQRIGFTEEDDRLLAKYVRERVQGNAHANGNKIYQEFEQLHPHHTSHSYRNRWVRHLSKANQQPAAEPISPPGSTNRLDDRISSLRGRDTVEVTSSRRPDITPQSITQSTTRRSAKQDVVPNSRNGVEHVVYGSAGTSHAGSDVTAAVAAPAHSFSSSSMPRPGSGSHNGGVAIRSEFAGARRQAPLPREQQIEARKKLVRSAKVIQRVWKGHRVRRNLSMFESLQASLQAVARGFLVRQSLLGGGSDQGALEHDEDYANDNEAVVEQQTTEQELFYSDLDDYLEFKGISPERVLNMKINGRNIDAWELWKAVTEQGKVPEYPEWEVIAERMGFDWIKRHDVTNALKRVFDENLREFALLREGFDCGPDEDDEEGEDVARGPTSPRLLPHLREAQQAQPISELTLPSSPPVRGRKRGFDEASLLPDRSFSSHLPAKRPRYSRADEIPQSPEPASRSANGQVADTGLKSSDHRPQDSLERASSEELFPELQTVLKRMNDIRAAAQNADAEAEPELPRTPLADSQHDGSSPSQQLRAESGQKRLDNDYNGFDDTNGFGDTPRVRFRTGGSDQPSVATSPGPTRVSGAAHSSAVLKAARGTPPGSASPSPPAAQSRTALRPGPVRSPKHRPQRPRAGPVIEISSTTSSSPVPPPSSRSHGRRRPAEKLPSGAAVEEAIERFMALGYEQYIVVQALKATCMNVGEASHVMESLKKGRGFPPDKPGVWTPRDDEALWLHETTDLTCFTLEPAETERRWKVRIAYDKLQRKHGPEGIKKRKAFLEEVGSWVNKGQGGQAESDE